MDRLEHYLDQVCRSIGGPRSLRQHVRQELREHLLDAMTQHKNAGLTQEQALDRALAEFGQPEDVRSELEATHGQRLLAVVIDRALEWKERTMRAKWLWASWAYLALVLVIALEVLFITFNVMFIIPKFRKLMQDGIIDPIITEEHGIVGGLLHYLDQVEHVCGNYMTPLLLGTLVLVVLFEWRVKSENKPFMRLSALGTVAAALIVVMALMSGALVIGFAQGVPGIGRMSRPFAEAQVASVDAAVSALEVALVQKDWAEMDKQAQAAGEALKGLSAGPVVPSLANRNEASTADELRAHLKASHASLAQIQQAIGDKDARRLEAGLERFKEAFAALHTAARNRPR